MAVEMSYPHLLIGAGEPARLERNPRVRVAQIVMDYNQFHWTAEQFCEQYPHLTPAEVHAALTYYYDHRQQIDDEIQAELKDVEADRARAGRSPLAEKLRARGLL
jgi:uncharacterized protein (DUF433 family)